MSVSRLAWTATYGQPVLDDAFRSLDFEERADGGWSLATHTFTQVGEGHAARLNQVARDGGEIEFQIEAIGSRLKLPPQRHLIVGSTRTNTRAESTITIVTVEKRALMLKVSEYKHYQGQVHEQASRLLQDAGLTPWRVEPTQSPEAWQFSHNPGMTQHEFLNYLRRRAGAYSIFSYGGDKVGFCTLPYQAESRSMDPLLVKGASRTGNEIGAHLGGRNSLKFGFSHSSLELLVGVSEPPQAVDSTRDGLFSDGVLIEYLAGRAQEELVPRSQHLEAWCRSSFTVELEGNEACGWPLPHLLDIGESGQDRPRGYAVVRHHSLGRNSVYRCHVTCVGG